MTATMASSSTIFATIDSPIGILTLTSEDGSLTGIQMHEQRHLKVLPVGCRRDGRDSRVRSSS